MGIGLSGINSGMDTDAIVEALVMTKTAKKNQYVKAQKKLEMKQDAWKTLNSKIYSFYTKTLSNMRMVGSFNKKTTSVSNPAIAKITANSSSVSGTQTLGVRSLAKAGYLTGGQMETADGGKVSADTTMEQMGIKDKTTISVSVGGKESFIDVNKDMTLNTFVKKLQETGVNANLDTVNQRIFISSKSSGKDNDFSITAASGGGVDALKTLGLYTNSKADVDQYKKWAEMSDAEFNQKVSAAQAVYTKEAEEKLLAEQNEGYKKDIESLQKQLEELQVKRADDTLTDDDRAKYDEKIQEISKTKDEITESMEYNQKLIDGEELSNTDGTKDSVAIRVAKKQDAVRNEYELKRATAQAYVAREETAGMTDAEIDEYFTDKGLSADVRNIYNTLDITADSRDEGKGAVRIAGEDAEIELNGAKFTSSSNTFNVNGLTITAQELTGTDIDGKLNTVSITTSQDTEGVYNMVKDFLKGYNELINEMDKLYNASSAKGYEPLTDEEKAEMTDKEIELWEEKIKGSLLRRDSSLDKIIQVMKNSMAGGVTIDGKKSYLSQFGIQTGGYLYAAENERGAYHINGDEDDELFSAETNKLMQALVNDPDQVAKVISGIASNLYNNMTSAMRSTTMSSSYTVYNDKQMKEEYNSYTEKIAAQEEKIKWWEDYYRSKFTAMEKMLASLNQQQSSLSGMLGS